MASIENRIPQKRCCLLSTFDTLSNESFVELQRVSRCLSVRLAGNTHNHAIAINQNHDVWISILQISAKHHPASADASYPHIITIETELSHTLLCVVQLLLQISPRAPRILQVQLCIVQFLCQSGILFSVCTFDSLGVEHEILQVRVTNSPHSLPAIWGILQTNLDQFIAAILVVSQDTVSLYEIHDCSHRRRLRHETHCSHGVNDGWCDVVWCVGGSEA